MVPWSQSAITGGYRVPDNLLDYDVSQRCVFPSDNAEPQLFLGFISEQLHHVGLGHQTGPQGRVICKTDKTAIKSQTTNITM